MKPVSSLADFGPALTAIRKVRVDLRTRRAIADRAGCKESESDVVDWEEGRAFPAPKQFGRLRNMVDRSLIVFKPLLEEHWRLLREKQIASAFEEEEQLHALPPAAESAPAPSAPPTPAPTPKQATPPTPTTSGQALRQARERSVMAIREVAELVGVTEATIYHWEAGAHSPGTAALRSLQDLFPELAANQPAPPMEQARPVAVVRGDAQRSLSEAGSRYAAALAEASAAAAAEESARRGIEAAYVEAERMRQDAETAAATAVSLARARLEDAARAKAETAARAAELEQELRAAAQNAVGGPR